MERSLHVIGIADRRSPNEIHQSLNFNRGDRDATDHLKILEQIESLLEE